MAPGGGGDPLGDLALEHEHEALGPRLVAEHVVEDGARDVVRQVGHERPRARLDERRSSGDVEDVAVDEPQGRRVAGEALAQVLGQRGRRPRRR